MTDGTVAAGTPPGETGRAWRGGSALALLLILGLAMPIAAAAQTLRVSVEPREATVQERLVLSVTLEGSSGRERPELPPIDGFEVRYMGPTTEMQWVNGNMTRRVSHRYALLPRRPGDFVVPPIAVNVGGSRLVSEPVPVRVLAANEPGSGPQPLFIEATVSDRQPYVGEQVVFTWRLYSAVRTANARLESLEFGDLTVESLGGDEIHTYRTTRDGQQYDVSEIRRALFAQTPGEHVIPPSSLSCQVVVRNQRRGRSSVFDDFFGRVQTEPRVLRTRPITLEVQPLPPPPAAFSGLIGEFDISSQLGKRDLEVGESSTEKVVISGTGNAHQIPTPKQSELEAFKIYDDRPQTSLRRDGDRLRGSKTFSRALVPLRAGDFIIPPVELVYFDPDAGAYRTKKTAATPVSVAPSSHPEDLRLTEGLAPSAGKVAVRILADDILPIQRDLAVITPGLLDGPMGATAAFTGLLAPPLFCLAILFLHRRRERFRSDEDLRRRHGARRHALAALRGCDDAPSELSRILRTYIGDRLGLEGTALTADEAGAALRHHGIEHELVADTVRLLDGLETARYAAAGATAGVTKTDIESSLQRLEKELR